MSSESNGDNNYKVIVVETAKSSLRRMNDEMKLKDKGASFLNALEKITHRLRKDPRAFGESLYRLPTLSCVVYQGVINPLVVTYAVHDLLPLVFIRVVALLSDPDKSA